MPTTQTARGKCAYCGEEFTRYPYRERKYCSAKCYGKAMKESWEQSNNSHLRRK